jgi:hypothetical protein
VTIILQQLAGTSNMELVAHFWEKVLRDSFYSFMVEMAMGHRIHVRRKAKL